MLSHEFSFDRFHKDADRLYRVNQTFIRGEGNNDPQFASTGPGIAYAVDAELSEVELLTSIHTPKLCFRKRFRVRQRNLMVINHVERIL
jgi:putative ABC transport system permease protein